MSTIRITNISSERVWLRDLYTGLAPGEVKDVVRTPAECGSMGGLQTAISDGLVSVTVIPDASEIASKLIPVWPLGMNWRPSVAALGDLPASGNTLGDIRSVTGTLGLYGWDGAAWQSVGGGGGGGTVTGVTASSPLASSGGTTPNITFSGWPANVAGALTNNGSGSLSWVPVTPTPPGGGVGDLQLNDGAGGFTGSTDLSFAANVLEVNNTARVTDGGNNLTLQPAAIGSDAATLTLDAGTTVQVGGVATVNIAGAYTLPAIDGAVNRVLMTDGAGTVSWQPQTSQQLGNRIHWVVAGGLYATIQAAINAASAGDIILVGPAPAGAPQNGSWGAAVFSENKRLIVSGLGGVTENKNIRIDSVTFSPTTVGLQINENEIYISGLYITGTYGAGQQAVLFGGTGAGRMRLTNCYIYANASSTGGDCVVNSNAYSSGGVSSSLYLDGCTTQNASTSGRGLRHSGSYTLVRRRGEITGGQYAVSVSAGIVEVYDTSIQMDAAREVVQVSGGSFIAGYSTIKNATANGTGVNLTAAGAVCGMGDATFAIATGTGYCVNGVAGSYYLYGHVTYSNSTLTSYNTRVHSTVLTAYATAQTFTAV